MNKFTYKDFRFILNDRNGDGFYRPKSVDILLTYENTSDRITEEIDILIKNAIDSLSGGLIISNKDENFEYMMGIYKNGVFDCIAVATEPEELTMENLDWLEREFFTYLNDSQEFNITHLFINT